MAKDVSNESESQDVSTYYVMSVSGTTKYSTGNKTESGVTMNGRIVWEDEFGPVNKFISCSGDRSGSYGESIAFFTAYGDDDISQEFCHGFFDQRFVGVGDSSYIYATKFTLKISTGAEGVMGDINLFINSSIFD